METQKRWTCGRSVTMANENKFKMAVRCHKIKTNRNKIYIITNKPKNYNSTHNLDLYW